MKERNMTFCREEIEKLSNLELESILRTELDNDTPERETVLLVLSILEERDPTNSINRIEGAEEAWDEVTNKARLSDNLIDKPNREGRKWFPAVAAAAVIGLVLLITVPQTVGAASIFEIIGKWTRDIFSLSDGIENQDYGEYIFQTDHEGLQQVYDAVVDQGVTVFVVPSWIPEGYELKEFRVLPHDEGAKVYAHFAKEENYIQFVVETYEEDSTNKYPKNEVNTIVYDLEGVYYYIVPNEDTWKAIWNNGIAECSLVTNVDEDTLYQILNSIQGRTTK